MAKKVKRPSHHATDKLKKDTAKALLILSKKKLTKKIAKQTIQELLDTLVEVAGGTSYAQGLFDGKRGIEERLALVDEMILSMGPQK